MQYTFLLVLFYQLKCVQLSSKCFAIKEINGNKYRLQGPDLTMQQCNTEPVKNCSLSRYRTLNGICNNLKRPAWGATGTPYVRLLDYNYGDGISKFPKSVTGRELPPPRNLSLLFFKEEERYDNNYNVNALMWGQVFAHDVSLAAGVSQTDNGTFECCKNGKYSPDAGTNQLCAPIRIYPDDPYQGPFGVQCLNFQRTDTTRAEGCSPPDLPSEQLNIVTAFLDASLVYGISDNQAISLREMRGGRLKTKVTGGNVWLPQNPNPSSTCEIKFSNEPCYKAGDGRVNQNPHLTLLQIVFLREHNRIADNLALINPKWDDETIYQESRRIVIAEFQHINYYEYMIGLLGIDLLVKEKLVYPGAIGYVSDYDPEVNPTIINEFTTAAFRHSHNELVGLLKLVKENRRTIGKIRLSNWFNRPLILEIGNNFNDLARGLTVQKSGCSDQYWDLELTQYLFRGNNVVGDDLGAIDIQRGRDHGLGTYAAARAACRLPVPRNFSDMIGYISYKNVKLLKSVYESTADIDLSVGGALERPLLGSKAGPTFTCIMIEQLRRTRTGDRFFYENGNDPQTRFSLSQLNSIRTGASAARLFCDNVDDIQQIQPNAFKPPSLLNPIVPCSALPAINLQLWKTT